MNIPVSVPFNGGMDRSVGPLRAQSGFFSLVNMKYVEDSDSTLVVTYPFTVGSTLTQKNYWSGGASVQEDATNTAVYMLCNGPTGSLALTTSTVQTTVSSGGTGAALQVFYQTTVPATETILTGCLLIINSVSGLAINLGATLDVEMTGAAAFRWRKNGGGWTAGVPAIAGVDIDGGNATLYFLADGGFAGTETWAWTRLDSSYNTSAPPTTSTQRPFWHTDNRTFYVDRRAQVMSVRLAGTTPYAISVGYRPVYGCFVCVFENHLVVGCYSKTAPASLSSATKIVGWSDLNDLDNFIATDVNEADQYTIPVDSNLSVITLYICGLLVVARQLLVVTSYNVYYTPYYGLPLVFDFVKLQDLPTGRTNAISYTVQANNVGYIIGKNEIWQYNGTEFLPIAAPIISYARSLSATGVGLVLDGSVYDNINQELLLLSHNNAGGLFLYCFQERYRRFYLRHCDFGATAGSPVCVGFLNDLILSLGCNKRRIVNETTLDSATIVSDLSGGATCATPEISTQIIYSRLLSAVKETKQVYIAFTVPVAGSTVVGGSSVEVHVDQYSIDDGIYTTGPSMSATEFVTSASTPKIVPFRHPFRCLMLRITLTGVSRWTGQPIGRVKISAIEVSVLDDGVQVQK